MKPMKITLLLGAFALIVAATVFQPADAASAKSAPANQAEPSNSPAVQAIEKAAAAVRNTDAGSWVSPILKDSLLDLLAAAGGLALSGCGATDAEEANRILDAAAWTIDVAVRRVDGEAGESEEAHQDDWVRDPLAAADLHGLLVQARSEIFRAKRE